MVNLLLSTVYSLYPVNTKWVREKQEADTLNVINYLPYFVNVADTSCENVTMYNQTIFLSSNSKSNLLVSLRHSAATENEYNILNPGCENLKMREVAGHKAAGVRHFLQ